MKNRKFLAAALMVILLLVVPFLAQAAPGPSNVNVVNQTTAPVPVSEVNVPVLQPVTIPFPDGSNGFPTYTVPTGKVLVLDYINAFLTGPSDGENPIVQVLGTAPGGLWFVPYPMIAPGTNLWLLHEQLTAYAPPGAVVSVQDLGPFVQVTPGAAIYAHLVNAP